MEKEKPLYITLRKHRLAPDPRRYGGLAVVLLIYMILSDHSQWVFIEVFEVYREYLFLFSNKKITE